MSCLNKTIDPVAGQMLAKAQQDQVETVWQRFEDQQPQCGFGLLGLCCRHCNQGPCRIDPFGDGPQLGICGANADLIVARNLLRQVAAGAAAHVDHAYEALETLAIAIEENTPYSIKDSAKLQSVASKLGIESNGKSDTEIAKEVLEVLYADFASHTNTAMRYLTATAPPERVATWQKLGVLPRNPDREITKQGH
jgi:anaerobic carbon-monoxide dehydrogenase catalytic subunit